MKTTHHGFARRTGGRTAIALTLAAAFPMTAMAQSNVDAEIAARDSASPERNRVSVTVGGQLLRPQEAGAEIFSPDFISAFDPKINPANEQRQRLDWGDARALQVSYISKGDWVFSLGTRWGQSRRNIFSSLEGETVEGCAKYAPVCEPGGGPAFAGAPPSAFLEADPQRRTNYGQTALSEIEDHQLVDFMVGRDVGVGGVLSGRLSAGLRFAHFESRTEVELGGTPDWNLPEQCWSNFLNSGGVCFTSFPSGRYANPATRNEYQGEMRSERTFRGAGPVVAWSASNRLWGDDRRGHLNVDWAVSGGILFGKQKTAAEGNVAGQYFVQYLEEQTGSEGDSMPDAAYSEPFQAQRSESATVPVVGLDLGMSYRIEDAAIAFGYRWEQYFSVVDGGISSRKTFDRTLDGPYLTFSLEGGW